MGAKLLFLLPLLLFVKNAHGQVTITQDSPSIFVDENHGDIVLTFTLSRANESASTFVQLFTVDSSAKGGLDYTQLNETVEFPPNTTAINRTLTIIDDDTIEQVEFFSVEASLNGVAAIPLFLAISDNDVISIAFDQAEYTYSEVNEVAEVCASIIAGTIGRTVDFTVSTSLGNASNAVDYIPFIFSQSFTVGGSTRKCVNISLHNDTNVENTEFLVAQLTGAGDVDLSIGNTTTVFITDTNGALLRIVNSTGSPTNVISILEGDTNNTVPLCVELISGGEVDTVMQINGLGRSVSLLLTTFDGTAYSPNDFLPVSELLVTLPVGSTNGLIECTNVSIVGDTIVELTNSFSFTFTPTNPLDSLIGGATGTVVLLNDDDCGSPPSPGVNGLVNYNTSLLGDTARYLCNNGYQLSPNTSIRLCLSSGSWSGVDITCLDMNECEMSTDNCDQFASCTNTNGSFSCSCLAGFNGDGLNCTDINECMDGNVTCADNAQCMDSVGSYTCSCNEGFSGDGVTNCTDVNECEMSTDNCDQFASCTNTNGSFSCSCLTGFIGDGVNCTAVDCGVLPDPVNGLIDINMTTFNNSVSYSCDIGYELIGNETRTCQDNGNWSGNQPSCNGNTQLENAANEFYLGFAINSRNSFVTKVLTLLVSTPEPASVGFNVTANGFSFSGVATNDDITEVSIPNSLEVQSSDISEREKGIIVKAEGDRRIVVYGLSEVTEGITSDAFLALPCSAFAGTDEYEYYAVGYTVISAVFPSVLLIVACEDNTVVTLPSTTITLERRQTYQVTDPTDLTGTRVISTKPISVFSGVACTNVPSSLGFCDYLIEQIPPTATWGTKFLVASLLGRDTGERIRILTAQAGSTVTVNCTTFSDTLNVFSLSNAGDWMEIEIVVNSFCSIEASSPVFVAQYAYGGNAGSTVGDPFMMMIAPIEQYSNNYVLNSPSQFPGNYFTIYVAPEYFQPQLILLDDSTINEWSPVHCSNEEVCGYISRVSVSSGSHRLYHENPLAQIGVSGYGFENSNSYGYPGGLKLSPLQFSSAVDCGVLSDPVNGLIDINMTTFNNSVSYSCDIGYELDGNETRTCQVNGNWSGNQPSCNAIDCGSLVDPTNGAVTHTTTTFQSVALYSCGSGYTLSGLSQRDCLATGGWSGSPPICLKTSTDAGGLLTSEEQTRNVGLGVGLSLLGLLLVVVVIIVIILMFVRQRKRNATYSLDRHHTTYGNVSTLDSNIVFIDPIVQSIDQPTYGVSGQETIPTLRLSMALSDDGTSSDSGTSEMQSITFDI